MSSRTSPVDPRWLIACQAVDTAKHAKDKLLIELVNAALPGRDFVKGDLEESSWECPDPDDEPTVQGPDSPTGFCAYTAPPVTTTIAASSVATLKNGSR